LFRGFWVEVSDELVKKEGVLSKIKEMYEGKEKRFLRNFEGLRSS